jgi:hypothetical protein
MSKQVSSPLVLISTFLWIGFVFSISFMEAWLKFQAPGITLPLGLGIGRLVFGALNKVEIIFCLIILLSILIKKIQFVKIEKLLIAIPLLILVAQTFWLLPVLDARAEIIIQGNKPPESYLHLTYIVTEFIKVICLSIFGIKLFK